MRLLESIPIDILDNFFPPKRKCIYPKFQKMPEPKAERPPKVSLIHYTANARWTSCGLSQRMKLVRASVDPDQVTCHNCKDLMR